MLITKIESRIAKNNLRILVEGRGPVLMAGPGPVLILVPPSAELVGGGAPQVGVTRPLFQLCGARPRCHGLLLSVGGGVGQGGPAHSGVGQGGTAHGLRELGVVKIGF